jgi:hypothetical protein
LLKRKFSGARQLVINKKERGEALLSSDFILLLHCRQSLVGIVVIIIRMVVIVRRHLYQIQRRYDVVAAFKLDRAAAQVYYRYVRNILVSLWKRRMEYTSIIVRL